MQFRRFGNEANAPWADIIPWNAAALDGANVSVVPEEQGGPRRSDRLKFTVPFFTLPEGNDADQWPMHIEGNLRPFGLGPPADPLGEVKASHWHWAVKVRRADLVSIEAAVPSTPYKTIRAPNAGHPPARTYESKEIEATWAAGKSIVLVENAADKITLSAITEPADIHNTFDVRWVIERNPEDAGALQANPFPEKEVPTINTDTGVEVELSLDAVGSFSVIAYLDLNDNGEYDDPSESAKYLNIVIARVTLDDGNQSVVNNQAQSTAFDSIDILVNFQQHNRQVFRIMNHGMGNPIMQYKVTVDLFGGGANGRLGLERVASAWNNNLTGFEMVAEYEDDRKVRHYWSDEDPPSITLSYMTEAVLLPDAMDPVPSVANPLLDTGRDNPGTGRLTACIGSTGQTPVSLVPIGQRRTVQGTMLQPYRFQPNTRQIRRSDCRMSCGTCLSNRMLLCSRVHKPLHRMSRERACIRWQWNFRGLSPRSLPLIGRTVIQRWNPMRTTEQHLDNARIIHQSCR